MAKIFLISINIVSVFALKIFFGGDVKVEQKMKDAIRPGETLDVTLEITKGDREGFAKWQQSLPQGFIASVVEMNGATFSFKNQEIKVIWMELPKTETFTIKYKIETSSEVSGEHNLKGKFSFIEENERRDISAEVFILTIDEQALAGNKNTSKVDTKDENSTENTSYDESEIANEEGDESSDESNNSTPKEVQMADKTSNNNWSSEKTNTVVTKAIDNNLASITRKVKHIGNGNYEVNLEISKSDLSSFGKIEEYLPPNYVATPLENQSGFFSFKKNVMKILWMTLPARDKFEISYAMQSTSDELDSANLHGVFSFLNDDESVQNKLAPTKFRNFLSEQEVLADESEQESEETADNNSGSEGDYNSDEAEELNDGGAAATDYSDKDNSITPNTSDVNEELIQDVINIPAPETAIAYKVQIAAGRKEVEQNYFEKRHNITESVSIEYHETWYKYTIGSYPIYKQARDRRNEVWAENNKINDAFVTAYSSGERISVQEALMISKQKWFK